MSHNLRVEMPPIRYATARDGTAVAYTVIPGDNPPWLHLYSIGAPTIELDFSSPARLGSILNLARGRATVLYDHRGSGFSGPIRGELTLDDLVDDLRAVTLSIGQPLDVMVMGTGCFSGLAYAATDGHGWRSLLLLTPVPRFAGSYQDVAQAIWRAGHYREFLRTAARVSMEVSVEEVDELVRQWATMVPEATAAAYAEAVRDVDATTFASQLKLPVVVCGSPGMRTQVSVVAAAIPGAPFVEVDSSINRPALGTQMREAWDRHIAPFFDERPAVPRSPGSVDGLSAGEVDVLRLVATGQTNRQIAAELVISEATVASRMRRILEKTGCHNRAEAVSYAFRMGIEVKSIRNDG